MDDRGYNGVLYVVATPIGNLKDITLRAVEVLREVDFVVAEDRERALKLLSHLDIRKPISTINSYNEKRRAGTIVDRLSRGESAALITAAGTPCISDPGDPVVRACSEAGIEVQAVPGASAALAALSIFGPLPRQVPFLWLPPLEEGKKEKGAAGDPRGSLPGGNLRVAAQGGGDHGGHHGGGAGQKACPVQGDHEAPRRGHTGHYRRGARCDRRKGDEGRVHPYRRRAKRAGIALTP